MMTQSEASARLRSYRCKQGECRARIASLDVRIARLWSAYDRVGSAASELRQHGFSHTVKLQSGRTWTGSLKRTFDEKAGEISPELSSYLSRVDDCRDAIREEIRRLENEKTEQNGLIGWFQARWNDLSSWMDQTFN